MVTDPATEQTMLSESPLMTIASLLGINQLATGTVLIEDMERPCSVPPLMGMVV